MMLVSSHSDDTGLSADWKSHWWFSGSLWRHFNLSRLFLFSPLAGLGQKDQEACGCLAFGSISRLENSH